MSESATGLFWSKGTGLPNALSHTIISPSRIMLHRLLHIISHLQAVQLDVVVGIPCEEGNLPFTEVTLNPLPIKLSLRIQFVVSLAACEHRPNGYVLLEELQAEVCVFVLQASEDLSQTVGVVEELQ